MKRLCAALLFAVLVVGCTSQSKPQTPQQVQQTQPPATNPQEPTTKLRDGLYPSSTRTGVKELDGVLDAIAKKDAETLASLVKLSKVACTTQTSPGSVACPQGKPDGTLVEVFGWSTSLAPQHFYELDKARNIVKRKLTDGPLYVYAVYRSDEGYTIIFDVDKEDTFSEGVYLDRAGAIVAAYTHGAPAQAIGPGQTDFILAPKK